MKKCQKYIPGDTCPRMCLARSANDVTHLCNIFDWSKFLCVCLFGCKGYLDDLFAQLQRLQDASDPGFVADVISTYFEGSENIINDINGILSVLSLSLCSNKFHIFLIYLK